MRSSTAPISPGTKRTTTDLNARLDRLPLSRTHILWLTILGLAYLVETFDVTVFSALAPSLRAEWGLTIGQIGLLTSSVFVGMAVGALLGGQLSDRWGRRRVLILSSIFYSTASILSALAPSVEVLFIGRLLTGVGAQAATGVVIVLVSELFPKVSRGRFFTVTTFIGFVGAPVTTFVALAIAPNHVAGWRWVFVIGAIGFVVAILAAMFLPESVRWQTANGQYESAEDLVSRMEANARRRGTVLAIPETELPSTAQGTWRDLFKPVYMRRLIVTSVAFFLFLFANYGFVSWIPTILTDRGMDESAALSFSGIAGLAAPTAALVLFFFADRFERRTMVLVGAIVSALSLIAFAFIPIPTVSMFVAFTAVFGIGIMTVAFFTYLPEVFPTQVRGIGAGTANAFGRIAGIISGVAVAALYGSVGFETLYTILAVILLTSGLLIRFFGERTTQQSLEQISEK